MYGDDDYADSDELAEILEQSRAEQHPNAVAGSSRSVEKADQLEPSYLRKQNLNSRLTAIQSEINGVDQEIQGLKQLRNNLFAEKGEIEKQLKDVQPTSSNMNGLAGRKGKERARQDGIDYTLEFDWSDGLKTRMKKVFGIDNFRLCQQGVCNANMDGRDIVCVMPTGGGKSLTYQLPALFTPGCTLVVSPLISLITDQILHLRDAGVDAVMLTGGTPKAEVRDISMRLAAMASSKDRSGATHEIKLCYVTPEKIARNKMFLSMLEKLASAGKLARVVIDEAHCVSQLGHDYRPDYKKLSMLRQLFPRVPILALSATCPNKVLQDLLKIMNMKQTVDGQSAAKEGTVYFSAPLYRKNLHYTVLPKPSSSDKVIEIISDYILKNHEDDSGIIYCLTKKDCENVAKELREMSRGKIKTGVYHADVQDSQKENLHLRWRNGDIKVVCATIAFGLGIDKGNVRYVLHHSMSKSLDGFYQESGRAGRDGQDADCILYYRPQDATRLSSIMYQETQAQLKLSSILRFAQDLQECRKIQFAKYFSVSSDLSMASWTTDDTDALARCGHCDNCTRAPETVDQRDVTVEAWQILKIADVVKRHGGRLTLNGLGDLARGLGGGAFETSSGGKGTKGKSKEKTSISLDDIAGGKISFSKDDTETLIVHLLLSDYIEESLSPTSYSVNVYVVPGPQALRLTRFSREDLEAGKGHRIQCFFRKQLRGSKATHKSNKRASKNKAIASDNPHSDSQDVGGKSVRKRPDLPRKRKRSYNTEADDEIDDAIDLDEAGNPEVEDFTNEMQQIDSQDSESDYDEGWSHSMISAPVKKKLRQGKGTGKTIRQAPSKKLWDDEEVISLSSD